MAKGRKKSQSPSKQPKNGETEEIKKTRSSKPPKEEGTEEISTKEAKKARSTSKPPLVTNGVYAASGNGTHSAAEENVKVAVRVRSFNKRELDMKAKLIIEMSDGQTVIKNPNPSDPHEESKTFAFDYSYWSFDGCKERSDGYLEPDLTQPHGNEYCDQNKIFDDLGKGMLKNAWEGYNSTLFAYGQTGAGKSYSVVGYGANKGIMPMFCEQLFGDIDTKEGGDTAYEVTLSMLEIYDEVVRDLLNPNSGAPNYLLEIER